MQESSAVGRVVDLVRDLRARCPWDAAQTPQTLRPYLMEEVFELDHALGEDDPGAIRVELGDLLLHLAFQIVLAEERGHFGPEDLTRQVEQKMWRRHPHLFRTAALPPGGAAAAADAAEAAAPTDRAVDPSSPRSIHLTADQVKANWEKLKLRERDDEDRPSVLDGLPPTMPALVMARNPLAQGWYMLRKRGLESMTPKERLLAVDHEIRIIRADLVRGDQEPSRRPKSFFHLQQVGGQ